MAASPFLKWAGGKRWLAPRLRSLLGFPLTGRFVEPFLGSGAAFFHLQPRNALLGDCNPDLIATFRSIRSSTDSVIWRLSKLKIDRPTFDRIRNSVPTSDVGRAVRLLYLNRTAFNGLYRVNQEGEFNVPFGCKPGTELCDPASLRLAARRLWHASLRCQDFRETLDSVDPERDIIYLDPPYTVKHDNNGFRRYNDSIFTWSDQEELAETVVKLTKDGARVIVSNAHHRTIRHLYPPRLFHAFVLKRATCMAADTTSRGQCAEWVLVSRTLGESRSALYSKLHTG
jgi:DNA adenine methylase